MLNAETSKVQNPNSELEKFSLFVLKTISDENLLPTPANFKIYFEKLLENKPAAFKKKAIEYIETDDVMIDEYRINMESKIKEGFAEVKSIAKIVSVVYKNLNVMDKIIKKRLSELDINTNQFMLQNIISALNTDLGKLSDLTEKQMDSLKKHYDKTVEIVKEVENKAIFDPKYDVFNRNYFFESLKKESDAIQQYNHKSSIVLIKVKDNVLNKIINLKEKELFQKSIARLILKTSRRSDIIAYYGDNIFAIIMRHTDISNAQKACSRISELIYSSSFFIDSRELVVDIELAIMPIDPAYTIEESIVAALEIMPRTGKNLEPYLVGEYSNKANNDS
ncbi:MAG: diguanylate cyclase [Sulfurospirillaceae bacterium]|nr:diguanylate cyclase [Sulfurospirillaceae bacterium]